MDEPIASIRLSVDSGLGDRVMIRANGTSRESAISCVNSVVDWISSSQRELAAPYVASVAEKISDYERQLEAAKKILDTSVKTPNQAILVFYYASKIHDISDKLHDLRMYDSLYERVEKITSSNYIFIVDNNGKPLKLIILIAMFGLMSGLFFGVIIALYREGYIKELNFEDFKP